MAQKNLAVSSPRTWNDLADNVTSAEIAESLSILPPAT